MDLTTSYEKVIPAAIRERFAWSFVSIGYHRRGRFSGTIWPRPAMAACWC
jgi:hypothetical protein